MKIAKVAITNVLLWAFIWSPYAIVSMIGTFGDRRLVTPLVSQLPAFFAKSASALNPIVFALSHPKYKEALDNCSCFKKSTDSSGAADQETKMQTLKPTDTA